MCCYGPISRNACERRVSQGITRSSKLVFGHSSAIVALGDREVQGTRSDGRLLYIHMQREGRPFREIIPHVVEVCSEAFRRRARERLNEAGKIRFMRWRCR